MRVAEVDVVVIGAGAGGIMAAWRAASLGAKTVLLEKTPRIGTKILISGGGKCNITHDGPLESVLKAFRPNEARFIRPSCYRLTNRQIVDMLTSRGLRVYTRPDGRIFPVDQTAKDVVAILRTYLDEAKVDVRLETRVLDVIRDEIGVAGVKTESGMVGCRQVVLAVGGSSYPNSGTTGDGWPWATRLGHRLVPIRAALAPIVMAGQGERAGIALREIVLKARAGGKELTRWRGDLLFTHRGISGPTVLGISRMVSEAKESGPVTIEVDLAPSETFEELSTRLKCWLSDHPKKLVRGFLDQIVPQRLEDPLLEEAGISPTVIAAQLPQKQRNRLVEVLKGWRLGEVDEVWLDKGEVVAGGVALDEVDPQTMRSLKCPGLYLCGEVLDIAGPVGGYNLQAAFATGYVAGETAARDALVG
ncbi:MAG: NAD(P)/FAD-dependent oxidoreductase [Fimbriimonadaceae bacterium]|nr:NAD(P)/FAD-dependent oxidoreductase [Fimbriimonadaceae bacterium]